MRLYIFMCVCAIVRNKRAYTSASNKFCCHVWHVKLSKCLRVSMSALMKTVLKNIKNLIVGASNKKIIIRDKKRKSQALELLPHITAPFTASAGNR